MRTISAKELQDILEKHKRWLEESDGWSEADRANLRGANLSGANLNGAYLNGAGDVWHGYGDGRRALEPAGRG